MAPFQTGNRIFSVLNQASARGSQLNSITDDKLCTAEMNENIKVNLIEFEFRLS